MTNILVFFLFWLPQAAAQEVSLQVDSDKIYAGVPFVLTVLAQDFEEKPEPTIRQFTIKGCQLSYLGVSPSVSTQVSIFNGKRSVSRDVSFAYRYQITAPKKGTYTIAPIEVKQGTKSAKTKGVQFTVLEVAQSKDMAIRLVLPNRSVRVGEVVPIYLDLYLRKNADDQQIVVPLFNNTKYVSIRAPEHKSRQVLALTTAAGELRLPYQRQDNANLDGQRYTRFRLQAEATMLKAATIQVDPAQVVANLPIGRGRDRFGFPTRRYKLFSAFDKPQTLTIQPLPLQGQPKSFSGAVGESFSIDVKAKKTVVQLGEPITVDIHIRGRGELAGLQLPKLFDAGLDKQLFDVLDANPIGKNSDQGGKIFQVNLRIRSAKASAIPRLEFSFFNSKTGKYERAYSQPIALSVQGSAVVSADSVVSPNESAASPSKNSQQQTKSKSSRSLSGADLSLSTADSNTKRAWTVKQSLPITALLYIIPILLVVGQFFRQQGSGERQRKAQRQHLLDKLGKLLTAASQQPARDGASDLGAELKQWGSITGSDVNALLSRLEGEAYGPQASKQPLSSALLQDIQQHLQQTKNLLINLTLLILMLGTGLQPAPAQAEDAGVQQARQQYQDALTTKERSARLRAFQQSSESFSALVKANPHAPELLVDWGNAALGASDFGTAALAYHRALHLNPRHSRAKQNLSWIGKQLPTWAQPDKAATPLRTFLFWPTRMNLAEQLLLGGFLFMLLALGHISQKKQLRPIAAVVGLVWLSIVASSIVEYTQDSLAIVQADAGPLRAADSAGAPAMTTDWVPAGTAVQLRRTQGTWTQVILPNTQRGWLPSRAIIAINE